MPAKKHQAKSVFMLPDSAEEFPEVLLVVASRLPGGPRWYVPGEPVGEGDPPTTDTGNGGGEATSQREIATLFSYQAAIQLLGGGLEEGIPASYVDAESRVTSWVAEGGTPNSVRERAAVLIRLPHILRQIESSGGSWEDFSKWSEDPRP